jgi:hypothetical protein
LFRVLFYLLDLVTSPAATVVQYYIVPAEIAGILASASIVAAGATIRLPFRRNNLD